MHRLRHATARQRQILLILVVALFAFHSLPLASALPKKRSTKPKKEIVIEPGPTQETLDDLRLGDEVVSTPVLLERARQYHEDTATRRFTGPVLAYVTPWNRRGYEFAVTFNAKLTHVSPVWYQLRRIESVFVLEGRHEVNKTWMEQLRTPAQEGAGVPKIVPRVLVEMEPGDHVEMLTSEQASVTDMLVKECTAEDYDGLVLEVWMQWVGMNGIANDEFRAAAMAFVQALAAKLHALPGRKELIVATPPALPAHHRAPVFEAAHFAQLQEEVDGFSVMTYDYSAGDPKGGPNAPLDWLQKNVKLLLDAVDGAPGAAGRVLLGLNFYGYDFGPKRPQPIVNDEFLRLVRKHRPPLDWEGRHHEHSFEYEDKSGQHRVYYPTPRALQLRLQLAADKGIGVSIWELGQGLEFFFDLL